MNLVLNLILNLKIMIQIIYHYLDLFIFQNKKKIFYNLMIITTYFMV